MADTGQKCELELLFFDTFSHENAEVCGFCMVHFIVAFPPPPKIRGCMMNNTSYNGSAQQQSSFTFLDPHLPARVVISTH